MASSHTNEPFTTFIIITEPALTPQRYVMFRAAWAATRQILLCCALKRVLLGWYSAVFYKE